MNIRIHGQLAAIAGFALASVISAPAAAQTFNPSQAMIGPFNAASAAAPWSVGQRSSPGCNTGAFLPYAAPLFFGTTASNNGGLKYVHEFPHVMRNWGTTTYMHNTTEIPSGDVVMHPGATGECPMLRLTVPSTGGALRYFQVNVTFRGAYTNDGVAQGDGVNGMVLFNGNVVGNIVDTALGRGTVRACIRARQSPLLPPNTIDLTVHMKQNYGFDSTIVSGTVSRVRFCRHAGP